MDLGIRLKAREHLPCRCPVDFQYLPYELKQLERASTWWWRTETPGSGTLIHGFIRTPLLFGLLRMFPVDSMDGEVSSSLKLFINLLFLQRKNTKETKTEKENKKIEIQEEMGKIYSSWTCRALGLLIVTPRLKISVRFPWGSTSLQELSVINFIVLHH